MKNDLLNLVEKIGKNTLAIAKSPTVLELLVFTKGRDTANDLMYKVYELPYEELKNAGVYLVNKYAGMEYYNTICFCDLAYSILSYNISKGEPYKTEDLFNALIDTIKTDSVKNEKFRELIRKYNLGACFESVLEYNASKDLFKKYSDKQVINALKKIAKIIKVKEQKNKTTER